MSPHEASLLQIGGQAKSNISSEKNGIGHRHYHASCGMDDINRIGYRQRTKSFDKNFFKFYIGRDRDKDKDLLEIEIRNRNRRNKNRHRNRK